jgi:putative ubiquitin-RnfH superfamily antitoxin RatB of RatAB toxin-antitoxin module
MGTASILHVEVAYALPKEQMVISLQVPIGTTLGTAIAISGIAKRFSEIDLQKNKVGVFGRLRTLEYVLQEGDRIEIYRPLKADPKEARRARAAHSGK